MVPDNKLQYPVDRRAVYFEVLSQSASIMSLKLGLVSAVVLTLFIDLCFGIKCWECSSERDYNCGDPFNYTHFPLVDCDLRANQANSYIQGYAVCRKTRQKVNGMTVVDRSCAWEQSYEGPCGHRPSNYAILEHCSTCRYDACNEGTMSNPTTITAVATPILYILTKF